MRQLNVSEGLMQFLEFLFFGCSAMAKSRKFCGHGKAAEKLPSLFVRGTGGRIYEGGGRRKSSICQSARGNTKVALCGKSH
jgi:hypothetical protein